MAPVANAEEPRSGVAAVVAAAPRVSVIFVRLPTGVHLAQTSSSSSASFSYSSTGGFVSVAMAYEAGEDLGAAGNLRNK
jgi:hypothetical protein